ncbi:hypothetical protein [Bacillus sp. UNC438CL73TsuS30]|uniref:hypothetical protein n=1 Tax=Bacillus sp. UNC438CL73TsuS30 TaxID=1340434 RepID=UPI000A4E9D3C|nr:hypothetical protein [Bacillus sp. UNC438CL73TsuS30]
MRKKNEEQEPLTIHEKWEKDSELPNGGVGIDDSEWTGEYIEIQRPNERKVK